MIIGLVGKQGSGKDTVADYLVKNHNFIKLSFATPLKDIVSRIFVWDRELLEGVSEESRKWREEVDIFWNIKPREVLQKVGTELFRNMIDKDIWIKSMYKTIEVLPKNTNIVISDCRFFNEINFIKEMKGKIIKIERLKTVEKLTHESEQIDKLDKNLFNHIIKNDKDIKQLYHDIEKILVIK